MPSRVTIRCLAAYTGDAEEAGGGLVPLFVGRDDGTVERYDAAQDAELGIPSVVFHAHRKAVTGIVVVSPAELHTCSLDGTVKQWTLEETDGARVRATLVKTSTFPFAVRTMIQEGGAGAAAGQQRLFLGGEDGSLTLMEGERRSSWPAHDGGALTAIAVDSGSSGCVLTGGTDGIIYVWDMESGRPVCELRGHTGAITALSVVPVPSSIPVVRSKRAPVDPATVGSSTAPPPPSEVKDVLVHADVDDDGGGSGGASCLVSLSADSTLKVWLLPELPEAAAEADLMEREQQQQQLQQRNGSDDGAGGHRRSGGISFQEPQSGGTTAKDTPEKTVRVLSVVAQDAEGAAVVAAASPDDTTAGDDADAAVVEGAGSPVAEAGSPRSQVLDAKLHFLQQQATGTAWKSALKAPERRTVPFHAALGTVELPYTPYTCSGPSSGAEDGDADGGGAASLLYIGAAQGHVYGLKDRLLVREVCQHTAYNFQTVQQEVRKVQRTLRDATKVYARAAAAAMKAAEAKELKVAAKARRARLAEEKAAKKAAAEASRAARRAAAAAAAADRSDDEDYDEEDEAEEEEEEEEEVDEEEAEADEEAAEEGGEEDEEAAEADDGDDGEVEAPAVDGRPRPPRRPASWKRLTEEQRTALEALFTTQEKERDDRTASLQKAVEARLTQLQPLAKTPYHRSRHQFSNLAYTTTGCVRGGSAVKSLASAAAVPSYADKVYVTQASAVAVVTVQFGVTRL
ncbi:WD domain, G-beta repeat [Novymonas esmeraldas]|uniref:WD domain, G-beta repeat n=1 Tax=Novymonas esmeraldas TaxID=1808958 RepID=A0AAW0EYV7_9TRYP